MRAGFLVEGDEINGTAMEFGEPLGLRDARRGVVFSGGFHVKAFITATAQVGNGRTLKTRYFCYKPRGSGIKGLCGFPLKGIEFRGFTAGVLNPAFIERSDCPPRKSSKFQARVAAEESFGIWRARCVALRDHHAQGPHR